MLAIPAEDIAAMAPPVVDMPTPARRRRRVPRRSGGGHAELSRIPRSVSNAAWSSGLPCRARRAPSWPKRHQRNQDDADAAGKPAGRSGLARSAGARSVGCHPDARHAGGGIQCHPGARTAGQPAAWRSTQRYRTGAGLDAQHADEAAAGDAERNRHARRRRRVRPDGADRGGQNHHHRQAGRAFCRAPRRQQTGAAHHRQLPDRRPRAAAHLRQDSGRDRACRARRRRSAALR